MKHGFFRAFFILFNNFYKFNKYTLNNTLKYEITTIACSCQYNRRGVL